MISFSIFTDIYNEPCFLIILQCKMSSAVRRSGSYQLTIFVYIICLIGKSSLTLINGKSKVNIIDGRLFRICQRRLIPLIVLCLRNFFRDRNRVSLGQVESDQTVCSALSTIHIINCQLMTSLGSKTRQRRTKSSIQIGLAQRIF